jgi:carboxyl-terminal processing protease
MIQLKRFWPLPMAVAVGLALWAGCKTGRQAQTPPAPVATLPVQSLKPGPDDARIAYITARLLEQNNYLQLLLDQKISTNFFDGYINSLDGRHEYFLQSDLAEFSRYRTNLDVLTITTNSLADLSPAFQIYQRFLERFGQRAAYVEDLLHQDKFKFTGDDNIELDRRHAPFPKDLAEAEELWKQQVRYEYLQRKLDSEMAETNGVFTIRLPSDANTNIIAQELKHYRWEAHLETNHDSDWVLQSYLNALAHAYDPHSDYFSAPKAQDFGITMNLSLFGIGAQLSEDYGYCTINTLLPGGPAAKSKLINEKDRIIAVAQGSQPPVDVVDMDLEKVVQKIRGPKGTEVRLTISEAPDFTTRKVVSLVRDEIKLDDQEAKAKLVAVPDGHGGTNRIGIVELPSFYAPVDGGSHATPKYTSVDVAKLITKLKDEHASGIIIDLRFNPGGSLEEAIRFTGLFIKDGPVVQARNLGGPTVVEPDPDREQLYGGPLVVLVNRFSASAAEIAAAALQDYGRAVIVGDVSTHGKGTVQQLNRLASIPYFINSTNDPGELKVTIRKFYRITGASTQLKGVMSDIVLPDIFNYSKLIGESNLDNALPWDTIDAAPYEKMNLVQPYLGELRARSDARITTNLDFDYVRRDIDQYVKSQAEGTATLNERDAIKERERDRLKVEARVNEQESRPDNGIRIYELTVKNSSEPGLPPARQYLTTNYDNGPVTSLPTAGPSGEVKSPSQICYLYTNFFNSDYIAGFTNYFSTNCTTFSGVRFVYTNSPATNVIAEYDNRLNPTNATAETYKPSAGRTYMPDPMLDESERILQDYISLLQKRGSLTVNP